MRLLAPFFFLDAPARKDNASNQQNDIEVGRALAGALDVSWGDCRKELGWTDPKKRHRQKDRKRWETSQPEIALDGRKRKRNPPTKILRPSGGYPLESETRGKATLLVQKAHGIMSGVSKFHFPRPSGYAGIHFGYSRDPRGYQHSRRKLENAPNT